MDSNRNKNYFSTAGKTPGELIQPFHEGAPGPCWLTSHVPFANDIAYVHDFGWGRIFGNAGWNVITNYGSMLPAAATTFGGAAVNYSPITSGVISGMDHE